MLPCDAPCDGGFVNQVQLTPWLDMGIYGFGVFAWRRLEFWSVRLGTFGFLVRCDDARNEWERIWRGMPERIAGCVFAGGFAISVRVVVRRAFGGFDIGVYMCLGKR